MKSNVPKMQNGTARSEEFSYIHKPRTLEAYGKEYTIPVKTVAFSDKLDEIRAAISESGKTSDTVAAMKEGITLFIGAEETERIFPSDKVNEIDVDEILEFWFALNRELNRSQNELISRYTVKK